jgi:hypothetical protein
MSNCGSAEIGSADGAHRRVVDGGWMRRRKGGGVESRDLKGPGLWGLFELVLSLFEKSSASLLDEFWLPHVLWSGQREHIKMLSQEDVPTVFTMVVRGRRKRDTR